MYGRLKLFGLLGREEDITIPWKEIEKVGEDVLLVRAGPEVKRNAKKWFWMK